MSDSINNTEGGAARRETFITIPLSALNRLRITCDKCKAVIELSLTKESVYKLRNHNWCFNCWDGQAGNIGLAKYGSEFEKISDIVQALASLRGNIGAQVEFIITDPGKSES